MRVAGSKLGSVAIASAFFALSGLAQSAAANPIYLGPGTGYSAGNGIGTFSIPSVAQGLLFYLDSDDRPTEITLTGLYNNFGEKLHCIAVTRSTFACSIEGTLLAHYGDDQDEWQANSQGSGGSGSLGHGPSDNDPTTHLVNGSVSLFGAVNLVQTVNLVNDPPAEPSSVPEPGSLMLLAGALLSLGFARRRVQRLG